MCQTKTCKHHCRNQIVGNSEFARFDTQRMRTTHKTHCVYIVNATTQCFNINLFFCITKRTVQLARFYAFYLQ